MHMLRCDAQQSPFRTTLRRFWTPKQSVARAFRLNRVLTLVESSKTHTQRSVRYSKIVVWGASISQTCSPHTQVEAFCAPQTKSLEDGTTRLRVRFFEVLCKGVSTRFGPLPDESSIKNAHVQTKTCLYQNHSIRPDASDRIGSDASGRLQPGEVVPNRVLTPLQRTSKPIVCSVLQHLRAGSVGSERRPSAVLDGAFDRPHHSRRRSEWVFV